MKTKEITILFWDNQENFQKRDTQIGLGIRNNESLKYKRVFQFYSESEFDKIISELTDNDLILILVHVDRGNSDIGVKEFKLAIEDGRSVPEEKCKLISKGGGTGVYDYDGISSAIQTGKIIPYKKNQLFISENPENMNTSKYSHFDYAIFTALYENEFEEIEKLFDFENNDIKTGTTIYKVGKLKNTETKAVTCFATKSGMVEAAIIASEMINLFTPKYLFMPGVCGGAENTKFGSVIIAEKVFIFQKGKLLDLKENSKDGIRNTKLFYNNKEFDKKKLTNSSGEKINIIIERFEHESEVIEIDTELSTLIKPQLKFIKNKINEPFKLDSEKIDVQLETMACSMMVINKEDYFDDTILPIDRKTKAVEMESYGVARAAKIANGGKTKSLIFKSVMDKTKLKTDGYKEKAAYTSAQFLKHLLESEILK